MMKKFFFYFYYFIKGCPLSVNADGGFFRYPSEKKNGQSAFVMLDSINERGFFVSRNE